MTTLWYDGMSRSMLLYLSISVNACLNKLESAASMTGVFSWLTNSPRSGGTEDTVAQVRADMIVQMYNASEY